MGGMFYGLNIYNSMIKSVFLLVIGFTLLLANASFAQTNMNYKKATSLYFYNETVFQSLLTRLENIQPNADRKWGKMDVAQMLHHLNLAIGSGLGYYELPNTSNIITRTFNKWMILSVLKRFPMGTQTASPLKVASNFDFETEKKQLKEILEQAYRTTNNAAWRKHTYFGPMTRKQWGKLIVIHCNHHFQQFNN
jgi:hypothetical protein